MPNRRCPPATGDAALPGVGITTAAEKRVKALRKTAGRRAGKPTSKLWPNRKINHSPDTNQNLTPTPPNQPHRITPGAANANPAHPVPPGQGPSLGCAIFAGLNANPAHPVPPGQFATPGLGARTAPPFPNPGPPVVGGTHQPRHAAWPQRTSGPGRLVRVNIPNFIRHSGWISFVIPVGFYSSFRRKPESRRRQVTDFWPPAAISNAGVPAFAGANGAMSTRPGEATKSASGADRRECCGQAD